jgi:uncharacterized protein YndB with AHSA1/START domain
MDKSKPVVVENLLDATPEVVWKAITDKNHMKEWYFDLEEFVPEVGFKFQFTSPGKEGRIFNHLCEVTEVVPLKKITCSWSYEGHEGISYVTFELVAMSDKTKVILTHSGLDSFPDIAAFAPENYIEGWSALIGKLLKEYVESI